MDHSVLNPFTGWTKKTVSLHSVGVWINQISEVYTSLSQTFEK